MRVGFTMWWYRGRGLLAAALLAAAPFAAWAQGAGQMLVSVGEVRLIGADGAQRPAERGAEVREGDQLVTGPAGLAQIRLRDGTLLSVRADSDFKIERFTFAGSDDTTATLFMSIVKGGLRSLTGAIGSLNRNGYRITTPTATVGIRGTDHETVFVPPNLPQPPAPPGTYDRVYAGQTVLQTGGLQLLVNPNQVGFAPPSGAPPVILPVIPPLFNGAPVAPPAPTRDAPGAPQKSGDAGGATPDGARDAGPVAAPRSGAGTVPRAIPGTLTPLPSSPGATTDTRPQSGTGAPVLMTPLQTAPAALERAPATSLQPALSPSLIQQAPTTLQAPTLQAPASVAPAIAPALIAPTTTITPMIAPLIAPPPAAAPTVAPTAPAVSPTIIQQAPSTIIQQAPVLRAPLAK